MIGSGHSFTGAAVAPGVQLRGDRLNRVVQINPQTHQVTAQAGIVLHELNLILAEHGLALETMGDVDRQTIAGAISTGTHGSSRLFGGLATQVRALELVLADSTVVTCSPTQRPELFAAARISLGALGVITRVTLQCVPMYALNAVDSAAPITEILANFDALVEANDHFEFFWFPHTQTALTRRFQRTTDLNNLRPIGRWTKAFDERLSNSGLEALLRIGTLRPQLIRPITRLATAAVSDRDFSDLAPRVFASVRNVRFREGEYAVPRPAVVDCLRELNQWLERNDEPISFPFEVRVARRDDIWLSPAYQRDVAYVAFHQYHRLPHERWFGVCEDVLGAAGGRPHWGKMHRMDVTELTGRYPRMDDFIALRDELDPDGVFANPYLDHVFGRTRT